MDCADRGYRRDGASDWVEIRQGMAGKQSD